MQLVYSNSILNIAADCAASSEEGCFTTRDLLLRQECRIVWQSLRFTQNVYGIFDMEVSSHWALDDLLLWKRGWVLQERLLSPRILHFGSDQILWECNEVTMMSESFPSGMLDGLYDCITPTLFSMGHSSRIHHTALQNV